MITPILHEIRHLAFTLPDDPYDNDWKSQLHHTSIEKEMWNLIPESRIKKIINILKEKVALEDLAPHLVTCVDTTQLDFFDVFEKWSSSDLAVLFSLNKSFWNHHLSVFERLYVISSIEMQYVLDIGIETTGLRMQKHTTIEELIDMSSCATHITAYYEKNYHDYLMKQLTSYKVFLDMNGELYLPLQNRCKTDSGWDVMCQSLLTPDLYAYACTFEHESEWRLLLSADVNAQLSVNVIDIVKTHDMEENVLHF